VLHAIYIINRVPTPVLHGKSPYECLFGNAPDLKELKVFGSFCYASTSIKNRAKFDHRARCCAFVGYKNGTKGFVVLDIDTQALFVTRHVQFHEQVFPFQLKTTGQKEWMHWYGENNKPLCTDIGPNDFVQATHNDKRPLSHDNDITQ